MQCTSPIKGYVSRTPGKSGGFPIVFQKSLSNGQLVQINCQRCQACRVNKSREWAIRCEHEASLHSENTFLTLTYNPENMPDDRGLRKTDAQKFLKKLRFKLNHKKLRFFMCGEYGDQPDPGTTLGHPHYHLLIFNHEFPDPEIIGTTKMGFPIYTSRICEKIWGKGFVTIGEVNGKTAGYVARYNMKKIGGDLAADHYQKPDPVTGELQPVIPEYVSMSLKPGIGFDWYKKFHTDCFPSDHLIFNNHKVPIPNYYTELLRRSDPELYKQVKQKRIENTPPVDPDWMRELAIKKCNKAKIDRLVRTI